MSKIGLGDIFQINTNKGKVYFQCVKIDKARGDLINVFNKLYDKTSPSFDEIINLKDHYFVGFPLAAAHKRKLVEKVGNVPLPNEFKLPEFVRDKHVVKGEFLGWHIINVKTLKRQFVEKLSREQKQLSPAGIYNDTLLIEMIERGWNLENW